MATTTTTQLKHFDLREGFDARQYLSWPAIFAGNAVTGGLILVMLPFGAAAGLAMASPYAGESASGSTIGMLSIAWLAFMYLFSIAAGGYVAGRLRPRLADASQDEVHFRDMITGIVFWGVGMIISALFTFYTVTSAVSTTATALGSAVGGATSGAASVLPAPNPDFLGDVLLRTTKREPSAQGGPARSDAEVRAEIGRIFVSSAASGKIEDADRTYLSSMVSQRTGLAEPEAKARVDATIARATQMRDEAVATAKATAEKARRAASQAAFWTAVLSLLAGLGAMFAARLGGQHRDEGRYA